MPDFVFRDFINLYTKLYSFLVTDITLVSDYSSSLRKNLLERISKLIKTIDDKIKKLKTTIGH